MKKLFILALLACVVTGADAKKKKNVDKNKPVFTTIKENKITSITPEPQRHLL